MRKVPDEEQQRLIDDYSTTTSGASINGSGVGAGKTIVAVETALVRTAHKRGQERVIIMGPSGTFDGWQKAIYDQSEGEVELRWATTMKRAGISAADNKESLRAVQAGEPGWYFVTREYFASADWVTKKRFTKTGEPIMNVAGTKQLKRTQRMAVWDKGRSTKPNPFDVAIYDECQMVAKVGNRGEQSWRELRATYKLAQSADWFGNHLDNMYTITDDLWPNIHNGMSKAAFEDYYLESKDIYGKKDGEVVKVATDFPSEVWPGAFVSSLPSYFALPPHVEQPEPEGRWVDLSATQRKLYDQLEEDMVAELENDYLVVELPMHLRIRLRELSLGMFKVSYHDAIDQYGEKVQKQTIDFEVGAPSTKLDEARSIMADYPSEPFILTTHSQKFARKVALELPDAAEWSGKTSESEKTRIKREFIKGNIRTIVGTSSLAEGQDGYQEVCSKMIRLSTFDHTLQNGQVIGRIARRGMKAMPMIWDIIARQSYDEGVLSTGMARTLANNAAKALERRKRELNDKLANRARVA